MKRPLFGASLALAFVVAGGFCGFAHRPLAILDTRAGPEQALMVEELDVSQVAYCELTAAAPAFWMTLELSMAATLDLSLGVPVTDRLAAFRPAIAVLGPGLPAVDLGFPVPAGLGGLILRSAGASDPERFYEPFTGTESWILGEWEIDLSQPGRYYVVACAPSGEVGKLWVALGKREAFSVGDILALPKTIQAVRRFHEVAGNPAWLNVFVYGAVALAALGLWRTTAR